MENSIEDRLRNLEEKIDACLILLEKATTHDGFRYTFSDKSTMWRQAMDHASALASHVAISAAEIHPIEESTPQRKH